MSTSPLFGQTSGTITKWKKKRAKKLPPQKKYEYRKKIIQSAQRSSGASNLFGAPGRVNKNREPYVWMEPGYKPGKHPHKHKHHR